jgi:hypothetical protein
MYSKYIFKGYEFVFLDDICKLESNDLITELADIISKYSGKSKIVKANELAFNLPTINQVLIIGEGGIEASKYFKVKGTYIPITRKFKKDEFTGFYDSQQKIPFEAKRYLQEIDITAPTLILDDWFASGETILKITNSLKQYQIAVLVNTSQNRNIKLFAGASFYNQNKIRGYSTRSLFRKGTENMEYLDTFVKKRCGNEERAREIIMLGGNLNV